MKRLIILFLILVLSVWVGLKVSTHPSSVSFNYHQWIIEIPLWFFLIIELVLFAVCYLLLKFFGFLGNAIKSTGLWFHHLKLKRAHALTNRGIIELTEGAWKKSEKHLIRSAKLTEYPLINYLGAAYAAQEQSDLANRDGYLNQAKMISPESANGIEIRKAQFQMESHQLESAIETLEKVHCEIPRNKLTLKLLQEAYLKCQNWQALKELLPELKSTQALTTEDFSNIELKIYQNLLNNVAQRNDLHLLKEAWQQMPRHLRNSVILNAGYIQHLINVDANDEAEIHCREILKKQWSDELICLYGLIKSSDEKQQLVNTERYLKYHAQSPALLFALGRICIRNQLWGKAQTYLKRSLELAPNPEIYTEIAKLPKQLNNIT